MVAPGLEMVKAGLLTLPEIVRHLTVNAARVFNLPGGAKSGEHHTEGDQGKGGQAVYDVKESE